MLRSLHIDGSEFKEIRELEEVGSMLCDIDTWPEKWMQIGMREGEEKGIEKGEKMQARKIALRMLEKEKSIAEIAELTDLTEKEILELIDDIIDK